MPTAGFDLAALLCEVSGAYGEGEYGSDEYGGSGEELQDLACAQGSAGEDISDVSCG